jgi:hypothetical protein
VGEVTTCREYEQGKLTGKEELGEPCVDGREN